MELSDTAARRVTTDQSSGYLFNAEALSDYEAAMLRGLVVLRRQLEQLEKPWSGVSPQALSPDIASIDLTDPLPSVDHALEELQHIYLQHAVYFHHPRYAAHLNCPIAYPALLAEMISSAVNTSVDTWDQSAGATLIEQRLLDWTAGLIGLGETADGIFTSGGSQSNLMGLLLARDHFCRHQLDNHCVKQCGLPGCAQRFRIFCSEVSHFSIQKSAALLGLGYQAVVPIATDRHFRMDPSALQEEIRRCRQQGLIPIAVVATAGTTDFGSIDPLNNIADIARSESLWLHVDAAYGCGLLASTTQRHKLDGVQRADSVTVDYHKSFLQPVACSAFLTRDGANLGAVTHHAEYLNPLSAQRDGVPNLVNKSIQTTRRFDALKLWLTLRIAGLDTIGRAFDRACENAQSAHAILDEARDFECLHLPSLSTVVFRFKPAASLHIAKQHETLSAPQVDLDTLNDTIRKRLLDSGEVMVAATRVHGKRYLKFTFLNPDTTEADIQQMIALLRQHGQALLEEWLDPAYHKAVNDYRRDTLTSDQREDTPRAHP